VRPTPVPIICHAPSYFLYPSICLFSRHRGVTRPVNTSYSGRFPMSLLRRLQVDFELVLRRPIETARLFGTYRGQSPSRSPAIATWITYALNNFPPAERVQASTWPSCDQGEPSQCPADSDTSADRSGPDKNTERTFHVLLHRTFHVPPTPRIKLLLHCFRCDATCGTLNCFVVDERFPRL
jgi:hypothetical protein